MQKERLRHEVQQVQGDLLLRKGMPKQGLEDAQEGVRADGGRQSREFV
jgi:hypothetical protein